MSEIIGREEGITVKRDANIYGSSTVKDFIEGKACLKINIEKPEGKESRLLVMRKRLEIAITRVVEVLEIATNSDGEEVDYECPFTDNIANLLLHIHTKVATSDGSKRCACFGLVCMYLDSVILEDTTFIIFRIQTNTREKQRNVNWPMFNTDWYESWKKVERLFSTNCFFCLELEEEDTITKITVERKKRGRLGENPIVETKEVQLGICNSCAPVVLNDKAPLSQTPILEKLAISKESLRKALKQEASRNVYWNTLIHA